MFERNNDLERKQLAPGVCITTLDASKFNRCRISLHFAFPAKRETATAHALLPLVMERGYADCPDMTQMTKKLARLYGADLTVDARPLGANHNLCVSATGIKNRFALEGEDLTREYAALALGTAFHPAFSGGVLLARQSGNTARRSFICLKFWIRLLMRSELEMIICSP